VADQGFNLENIGKAVAGLSLPQAADWMARLEEDAKTTPALAATVEEAFVKYLRSQSLYSDMISGAASNLDTGRDKPANVSKTLGALIPGLDASGVEGMLRKDALIFSGLAKLRGSAAHPAIKHYADGAARFSDEDYKNLAKPLRLLVQTMSKAQSVPLAPAKRAWAGDKRTP
jgi:hypothetical protein